MEKLFGNITEKIGGWGESAGERMEGGGIGKLGGELEGLLERAVWDADTMGVAKGLVKDIGQAAGVSAERVQEEIQGGIFGGGQLVTEVINPDDYRKAVQSLSDLISDKIVGVYDDAVAVGGAIEMTKFDKPLSDDVFGAYRKGWKYPNPVEYGALSQDDIAEVGRRLGDMDNLMGNAIKPDVSLDGAVIYDDGTFGVGEGQEDGTKWTQADGNPAGKQTAIRSMNTQFRRYVDKLDADKGSNLGAYFNGEGDFGFGKNMQANEYNINSAGQFAFEPKQPYQPVKRIWVDNAIRNFEGLKTVKPDFADILLGGGGKDVIPPVMEPKIGGSGIGGDIGGGDYDYSLLEGGQSITPLGSRAEETAKEAVRVGALTSPAQKAEQEAMNRAMVEMQPVDINKNLFADISDNVDELLNKPGDPDLGGKVGEVKRWMFDDPPAVTTDFPITGKITSSLADLEKYGLKQSSAANSWAKKVWNKMSATTRRKILSALGVTTISGAMITAIVYSAGAGSSVGGSGGGGAGIPPTGKPNIPRQDDPKKDPDEPEGDDPKKDDPDKPKKDDPKKDDPDRPEKEDDEEEPPEMPDFWGKMKDGTMKKLRWVKNKLYGWGDTMWEWKGTIGSGLTLVGGWIYKGGQALYELTGKALDNAKILFAFYAAYKLFNNPVMFFAIVGLAAYYLYKK